MALLNVIKEALEEVTSLQVATLYGASITLDSGIDPSAKSNLEQKIAEQTTLVNDTQTAWLAATELSDRWDKHRAYRSAKRRLAELNEVLNGVSPSDIFAKIQLSMSAAKTAGYSRLQMGGDSTNYFDAGLTADQTFLIDAHKANVQSAIDTRQKLIDTAAGLLKVGQAV